MSTLYNRIVRILRRVPSKRGEEDLHLIEQWIRTRSRILNNTNKETLLDVIKHCDFVTREKDDVIIQQGERGHRFYIILRGQVSVLIKESLEDVEIGEESDHRQVERSQLGNIIATLGEGQTFGEIALITADCIRTASVVAEETTDLVIIHRDLYNRSISKVIAREYGEKINFIDNFPFTSNWQQKFKKQLAACLKKETFPFDASLARQGEPANNLFFILSGEVKLSVDPEAHYQQFERFMSRWSEEGETESTKENDQAYFPRRLLPQLQKFNRVQKASQLQRSGVVNGEGANGMPTYWSPSVIRKMNMQMAAKRVNLSLCLLGNNHMIGDTEFMLGLDTYVGSAVCTQETTIFILAKSHFDRVFRKRNPSSVKELMKDTESHLLRRVLRPHITDTAPLFKCLVHRAHELNYGKSEDTPTVQNLLNDMQDRIRGPSHPLSRSLPNSKLPPRRPLPCISPNGSNSLPLNAYSGHSHAFHLQTGHGAPVVAIPKVK